MATCVVSSAPAAITVIVMVALLSLERLLLIWVNRTFLAGVRIIVSLAGVVVETVAVCVRTVMRLNIGSVLADMAIHILICQRGS